MSIFSIFGLKKKPAHVHDWQRQFETGNAINGKTCLAKCDCGQWAFWKYGIAEKKEWILIEWPLGDKK